MKSKIYFKLKNGYDDIIDDIILEADTIEELQELAQQEVKKRAAIDAWSEQID